MRVEIPDKRGVGARRRQMNVSGAEKSMLRRMLFSIADLLFME